MLHQYITKLWTSEYIPQQWRDGRACHKDAAKLTSLQSALWPATPGATHCWRTEEAFKDHIKTALKKGYIRSGELESLATDRSTWWQLCLCRTQTLEEERTVRMQLKTQRRSNKRANISNTTTATYTCPTCNRCGSPGVGQPGGDGPGCGPGSNFRR